MAKICEFNTWKRRMRSTMRFKFYDDEKKNMKLVAKNSLRFASHATYNAFDCVIFSIDTLHPQNVIAKVQCFKFTLLSQQYDHYTTGPMETFAEKFPVAQRK